MKKIFFILILIFTIPAEAAGKKTSFTEEIFKNAKDSGKTIVINSYETWCGTCRKQTKILSKAKTEFEDVIFLSYEQSKNKNIAQKLKVEHWTTIVVYKGNKEVGRIVGQTDKEIIYSIIKKGI